MWLNGGQTQAEQRLVSKRARLDNGFGRDYLPAGSKSKGKF